jgi:hypothetical protein
MPKEQDIVYIIEKHCIPEIIANIGIRIPVIFDTSSIMYIIHSNKINKSVTSGIREYYRIIEKILLELNKAILLGTLPIQEPVIIIKDQLFMTLYESIKDQINYIKETNEHHHMYM